RGRDLAILDECESANDEHEKAQHLQHASIHERTPCAAGARAGDDDLRDMDESRMRGIRHGSGNSPPDGRTPRPARSVRAPPHGPTNLPEGAGRATVGTADRLRIVGDTPPKRAGLPDGHPGSPRPRWSPVVRWAMEPLGPHASRTEAGAVV